MADADNTERLLRQIIKEAGGNPTRALNLARRHVVDIVQQQRVINRIYEIYELAGGWPPDVG